MGIKNKSGILQYNDCMSYNS